MAQTFEQMQFEHEYSQSNEERGILNDNPMTDWIGEQDDDYIPSYERQPSHLDYDSNEGEHDLND
jgi:hypothetical protein